VSGLLPPLNKKLQGKEYNSFVHVVEAAQIEEQCLEKSGQHVDGGDWEHRGREKEQDKEWPWAKQMPSKKLAGKLEQKTPSKELKLVGMCGKGCWQCGKEGHLAAECPEQTTKSTKVLLYMDGDTCPGWPFKSMGRDSIKH